MNLSKSILTCARQLSLTTVRQASVIKPPVLVFGVEGRYATALYSAAMKEKKLDAVEKDMKDFKELLHRDIKLKDFIVNPLIKVHVKIDELKRIFTKKNYSPLTLNLVVSMAENGRLKSLVPVINCFNGVMSSIKGEVVCQIVSAKSLDAPTLAEFEKSLKKFIKKNETVILETKVDPALIGGAIVTIGDKYIDMSIASKIKVYNKVLREIV